MFLGQSHERLFHYQYLFIDTTMFWGSGNSWSTGCSCPICSRGTVEEQQGAHDLPPARHPHQPWAWRMGVRVESCCLEIIQIRWEDETILEHFGKISWTSGKSWDIFQHSGNIIGNVRLETISKFTIFYCSQRQRGVSGWWWSLAQVLLPWGYIEWIDVLHLSHTQSHKWSLKADQNGICTSTRCQIRFSPAKQPTGVAAPTMPWDLWDPWPIVGHLQRWKRGGRSGGSWCHLYDMIWYSNRAFGWIHTVIYSHI